MSGHAFVDRAEITVESGSGGDGCVAFRREKFVPRGGPNGGDGGKGGDVVLVADNQLATLLDLRYKRYYRAPVGRPGEGSQCSGKSGDDIELRVPRGTAVYDVEGKFLADLSEHGQRWIAVRGGRGGLGNQHFATPTNKAPRKATLGKPGERRRIILELKVLADIGLVGMPNAGKSTLLAHLTSADPKVADYPFTTLSPNLGVHVYEDLDRVTIADIPGLIEGAHTGAGLGARFLRHIERTRLLFYLIADFEAGLEPGDLRYQFELLRDELRGYTVNLAERPFFVLFSRTDEWLDPLGPELRAQMERRIREAFAECGALELFFISSHTGLGLAEVMADARAVLEQMEQTSHPIAQTTEPGTPLTDDEDEASLGRGYDDDDRSDDSDEMEVIQVNAQGEEVEYVVWEDEDEETPLPDDEDEDHDDDDEE
jgi:GTP-binding protein